MHNLIGDTIGMIHLVTAMLALFAGSLVLIIKKGTKRHKQFGYAYVLFMVIMLITAFMIYRLFQTFGIFHYAASLSFLTLAGGMIPIWRKKPVLIWKYHHFSFMYWSVIGLYAAFAAEILTRTVDISFFGMVGLATAVITGLGALFFARKRADWKKAFGII